MGLNQNGIKPKRKESYLILDKAVSKAITVFRSLRLEKGVYSNACNVGCQKNVQYRAKFKLLSENTAKSWK